MKTEYKIIADHLRSSCFLIADGILPSNEGRGYVLRRILRRAMRQLHKLGTKKALMCEFVEPLIKQMGDSHPELVRARALITETLKNEEEQFRKTLENGLKILEEEIQSDQKTLDGTVAFKLYDTYGFPLDLTQDILREKNIEVDVKGFERAMAEQKQRSSTSWVGSGEKSLDKDFLELAKRLPATVFTGYDKLRDSARVLAVTKNAIILDQTPFYATSGGQKGDVGMVFSESKSAEISATEKFNDLFAHFVKEDHQFQVGDQVTAQVNEKNRQMCAKNHSATHLMHKALKITLGEAISQKGSNVDAGYFTFDFNFNRAMTTAEIEKVEDLVNFYINQSSQSKTQEMSLEKARQSGAEALFGEKYDNEVRVVSIGTLENETPYSIELCGGTHVENTGEIEFFKIASEKSIASGVRRITAKTSEEAKKFVIEELKNLEKTTHENSKKITEIKSKISDDICYPRVADSKKSSKIKDQTFSTQNFDPKIVKNEIENLTQKITNQESEIKKLNKELQNLQKQKLLKNLDDLVQEKIGEITLIQHIFDDIGAKEVQEITNSLRQKHPNSTILALFGAKDDKIAACLSISQDLVAKFNASVLIKEVVTKIGGKGGGGKPDLAFGGGIDRVGINQAIAWLKKQIH